jgi:predicted SAM-dependent methyltransferase
VIRINVGCGQTPTVGWVNLDNSPAIRLARFPVIASLMNVTGALNRHQFEFIEFCRRFEIKWADAVRKIPFESGSAEVIYTSHMLEHLDQSEARSFLAEAHRVLKPDGIIRIAVPDIRRIVTKYLEHQDANKLIADTYLAVPKPRSYLSRISNLLIGARHHHWMYDEHSLVALLNGSGFYAATSLKSGETIIPDPGSLNLSEREDVSIYVEAKKSK